MTEIKLYGYATSPFVRKTACFLYYKDLPFTHVPVNPIDPNATLAHTNGTQVPVLEIDGEWRRESSGHAFWLDERFPEKPLCPPQYRDQILAIDDWINTSFLPSIFRPAIDGEKTLEFRFRFWRLAALVSAHTPMPEEVRHLWPDFVSQAPFIKAMGKGMDLSESQTDMQMRIGAELAEHIGEGPFVGGLQAPTMLDLAIFPQLVFGYMFGLEKTLSAARHPTLKDWMKRVAEHLPPNPTLAVDALQLNTIASGLE
ncbi:MAG: glutathione S-transferase family protein [Pseudomonadota bacterium]